MSEELLKILLPIISTSSLLIGAIALWVFYKGFRPILVDFNNFYKSIFDEERKKEIDNSIRETMKKFPKLVNLKAKMMSSCLIKRADKLFGFDIKNKNSKNILSYWSHQVFFSSWILALIYLSIMLFFVGYTDLHEHILWVFVLLLIFYMALLVTINRRFSIQISKNMKKIDLPVSAIVVVAVVVTVFMSVVVLNGVSAGAVAVAGVFAVLLAVIFKGAGAGVFSIVFAIATAVSVATMTDTEGTINSNIFKLLTKLDIISPSQTYILFVIFFMVMPMLNAIIDSISLSVSRYKFSELIKNKKYNFSFFIKISTIDFLWALLFKALVLFLLYIGAHSFGHTGGTFLVSDIKGYFNCIVRAIFYEDGNFIFLFKDKTNTMITLMISTTLLPTLIHFSFVFIVTIWTFIANSMKLIGLFFVGNGKFFSLVMSTISLLFLMVIFSLFFNSLAGDKSYKGKGSDSNNTTLSKQVVAKHLS